MRNVTPLLAVAGDGTVDVPTAVARLRLGRPAAVASDDDAVAVLVAVGVPDRFARRRVAWSHGVTVGSSPSIDR